MKLLKWFFNLKTAVKLLSAFIIIALIQVGVGILALTSMDKLNGNVGTMYNESVKPIEYMGESRYLFQELRLLWQKSILNGSSAESSDVLDEAKAIRSKIKAISSLYSKTDLTKEQAEILEKFGPVWNAYNNVYDESIQLVVSGVEDIDNKLLT